MLYKSAISTKLTVDMKVHTYNSLHVSVYVACDGVLLGLTSP